jgi:hypothetical protein
VKSLKTSNNKGDNFKVENGGIYKIFEDDHLQLALYTIYIVIRMAGTKVQYIKM